MSDGVYYKLPFPPSLWEAYFRRGYTQTKSTEYLRFIEECNFALKRANFKVKKSEKYTLSISLHTNWYTKGTKKKPSAIKKKDLDNYLKCVIDTVVTYIKQQDSEFDDSQIFSIYASKEQSEEDFCMFSLSKK